MTKLFSMLIVTAIFFAPGSALLAQDYLSKEVILTPKEEEALRLADDWSNRPIKPIHTGGGKVVYVHGATMPTIIGAPFQICDIELEPGEVYNEIVLGDTARWTVEAGVSRNGTTHIFVKPMDVNLHTTLVVTTNRRVYHMKLVSRRSGHTPYVGFLYESQLQAVLKKDSKEKAWNTAIEDGAPVDMSNLNFGYKLKGKAPWRPVKVYDDGRKMYLRLPETSTRGEVPALLVRQGKEDTLVNYRLKNNTFEVDGVFPHVILITGIGRGQDRVEIIREKEKSQEVAAK